MVTLTPENASALVRRKPTYGGKLITKLSDAANRGLILGLYGPGGIGKTSLAATITDSPLGAPALLLDAKSNPFVISSYEDRIDMITIDKFPDVESVRADIVRDKDCPYKSIIIDNLSELYAMALRDAYGPTADVTWQMHSRTTADMLQLVRNYIDLALGKLKLNIIFVFQETSEERTVTGANGKEKDKVRISEIAMNKACQSAVPAIVNFMGRIYVTGTEPPWPRVLDFRPIETMHQAKLQVDRDDEHAKQVPHLIYNPSLASVLDTIRGRKPWPTDAHADPSQKPTGLVRKAGGQ